MDDVVSKATSSISRCYSAESDRNMSKQQYEAWLARMAKANICTAPKLKSLPPTAEAFVQHVNHAHYQTMIWKSAIEMAPPIADPTNYGWPEEEARLLPVMFPQNVALVPDKVLQIIRCGCASTHPCSTAKCKYIIAQMSCSVFCKCHAGPNCNNDHSKTLTPQEDEDS